MKALNLAMRRDKKRRMANRKKRKKAEAIEKVKRDHFSKSLELPLQKELFPKEPLVPLSIKTLHQDLRTRFHRKCLKQDFTMAGKIKRMMLDLVEGKIDENEIQDKIGDFDIVGGFGLIPKGTPDMLLVNRVPKTIYDRFQQWCTVRGVSISWKIKQLMYAYIQDYID